MVLALLEFGFYNMDCMDAMEQFPDKYFDLAIIDPPYGIGESGKKNASRSKLATSKDYKEFHGKDKDAPPPEYFSELFRISKYVVIWGANHFISRIPYDSSCWLVWDKDNGDSDFADCELAWTNFKCAVRKYRFRWHGMIQENMREKEYRIHPTQKPVALYEWILSKFALRGDKVLDTHVGSASSLIACYKMGMQYMGFEIDADYYSKASERLRQHAVQYTLFNLPDLALYDKK
jgi:site-specific DNA-methyltransferase (adenine-specific)